MKQGNQFWYGIKLKDKDGEYLDVSAIEKVVFNFDELEKEYDGNSEQVIYDEENKLFKIFLTQQETQEMKNKVKIDARVKFKNNEILGATIQEEYTFESLNKDVI